MFRRALLGVQQKPDWKRISYSSKEGRLKNGKEGIEDQRDPTRWTAQTCELLKRSKTEQHPIHVAIFFRKWLRLISPQDSLFSHVDPLIFNDFFSAISAFVPLPRSNSVQASLDKAPPMIVNISLHSGELLAHTQASVNTLHKQEVHQRTTKMLDCSMCSYTQMTIIEKLRPVLSGNSIGHHDGDLL